MTFRYGSWTFIFCCIMLPLFGGPARDSLYEIRSPGNAFVEKFRSEPAFNYTEVVEDNPWGKHMIRWLADLFGGLSAEITADVLGFLLKMLVVSCLIYALYLMVKAGVISPWGQKEKKFKEETLNTVLFSDPDRFRRRLEEALKAGNYKSAVRIHYLNVLFLLNEKGLIHWDLYKTNALYLREIPLEKKKAFQRLSTVFDCVCYGDFEIDEKVYPEIRDCFLGFEKEIEE